MYIDWNKINTNYENSVKEFLIWLSKKYSNKFLLEMNCIPNENTICYCDLEKFFDDNGIIISILYRNVISNNIDKWYFKMYDDYGNDTSEGCKTRSEAKEQAIYKAFKILEERLNGKENIRSENI